MRMPAPRGRNQFTKAALARACDVAIKKGFNRVEVELPDGKSKIILSGITSQSQRDRQTNSQTAST
jgi:hypothetical protein